jgi:hypothetical protein
VTSGKQKEKKTNEEARHKRLIKSFVCAQRLFLLPRRGDRPVGAYATINVLLFFLCWFQDLLTILLAHCPQALAAAHIKPDPPGNFKHTWNEHNKLSSTLIIAPALSNSPQ